ncbi:hypothetical protein M231_01054 [Tremella mesenterica]|uniref:Uncharacterized protein n=1 Tax=Tremella mesenterica TaxID=5217 RepID=A0A4Q1BU31_TREME|nr:hypothetical protein M231_01054 [Tremella mesenterica]
MRGGGCCCSRIVGLKPSRRRRTPGFDPAIGVDIGMHSTTTPYVGNSVGDMGGTACPPVHGHHAVGASACGGGGGAGCGGGGGGGGGGCGGGGGGGGC